MIPQNQPLPPRPQRSRQPPPLRLRQHHPPKLLIHRLRLPIKITNILINHLQLPRKRTPGLPRPPMKMTRSMHIRPLLMHRTMNQKPSGIRRPRRIAPDNPPLVIHKHHVARLQRREMLPQRIRPEVVRVFGIPHADVAAHAFGEAFARDGAEGAGHVCEEPGAVFGVGGEGGDAGEAGSLRDCLEGGELFCAFFLRFLDVGFGGDWGCGLNGDGGGGHGVWLWGCRRDARIVGLFLR